MNFEITIWITTQRMSAASLDQLIVKTKTIFSFITFYITLYIYSAKEQALFPSIYVLYKLKLFLIHPNENLSHYKVFLKNQQHPKAFYISYYYYILKIANRDQQQ